MSKWHEIKEKVEKILALADADAPLYQARPALRNLLDTIEAELKGVSAPAKVVTSEPVATPAPVAEPIKEVVAESAAENEEEVATAKKKSRSSTDKSE